MTAPEPAYDTSVFVNCPFDPDYAPLFRALIFAIHFCGFAPRCALEIDDSGETRAEKIVRLIRGSRLGIHDISRTESNARGLPRFNMPYEFGLFAGMKNSGNRVQGRKVVLVLDRDRYRYQEFLSDIAGQDIRSHDNDSGRLIQEVRNWLQSQTDRPLPGGRHVAGRFRAFLADLPVLLAESHLTERDAENYPDYRRLVYSWVREDSAG